MRNGANAWLVVFVLVAATASACGGGAGSCDPTCGPSFDCFYGVCVPRELDAGRDGTVEGGADADAPPHDDGANIDVPDADPDGVGCTGPEDCFDGNPCTQDYCNPDTGACQNPALLEGVLCDDDGDPCTQDICLGGVCEHPPAAECCTGPTECDDGNPCTTDDCVDGSCSNAAVPDCCTRDADCMWVDHLWECNTETMTCYDPPEGEICASCMTRADCGDGGATSDDWCRLYGATERGCTKDCIDDLDCPGATTCWSPEGRGCAFAEAGCLCVSRFESCAAYNNFGNWCLGDDWCRGCTGCGAFVCRDGGCTSPCELPRDCPIGWSCEGGFCLSAG